MSVNNAPKHPNIEFSLFKNVQYVRETEILVQGLLEIEDTHHPRVLQYAYA